MTTGYDVSDRKVGKHCYLWSGLVTCHDQVLLTLFKLKIHKLVLWQSEDTDEMLQYAAFILQHFIWVYIVHKKKKQEMGHKFDIMTCDNM